MLEVCSFAASQDPVRIALETGDPILPGPYEYMFGRPKTSSDVQIFQSYNVTTPGVQKEWLRTSTLHEAPLGNSWFALCCSYLLYLVSYCWCMPCHKGTGSVITSSQNACSLLSGVSSLGMAAHLPLVLWSEPGHGKHPMHHTDNGRVDLFQYLTPTRVVR